MLSFQDANYYVRYATRSLLGHVSAHPTQIVPSRRENSRLTCCIIALALAWQLIAGWRWLKQRLGIASPARTSPRTFGVMAANVVDVFRHPVWQVTLLAVVALEAGAAGTYIYEHRFHINNEVQALVFNASGFAFDMCRDLGIVQGDS